MFLFRKPTDAVIHAFLQVQARLDFTYPDTGATAATAPASYVVDHTRIRLGIGEEVFHQAKIGLEGWKQFDLGWLKAYPADTPIRSGEVVAVVARTFGLWSVNAARIVYVVDEYAGSASLTARCPVTSREAKNGFLSNEPTIQFGTTSWLSRNQDTY